MFSSKDLFFTTPATTGYQIAKSLRFRASATAYLNRTPGSASDQKKWTFSAWVKRGQLGATQIIAEAGTGGTTFTYIAYFNSSDQLVILDSTVSGVSSSRTSAAVFRDPSAWYHIVVNLDAANSVCNGYVNGVAQTFTGTQPSNQNWAVNSAVEHRIGRAWGANTSYFDGYMADVNFIDGQALTPSSFGETDTTTGVWKPKAYTGTYGTNGFYLKFADNSAATAAAIGKDSSGNGNNWTPNNISVTTGVTYDSMIDTPTPYDDGGNGVGNYCVINPLDNGGLTLSQANLSSSRATTSWVACRSTIGVSSGKWYWEYTSGASGSAFEWVGIGTSSATLANNVGADVNGYAYNSFNGNKTNNSTSGVAYGATYTSGDVIGIALDMTTGTLTFYKNNVSQGTAYSSLSGTFFPMISQYGTLTGYLNFGQRPFTYTPPSGFKALNTQNLPTPTIAAGANYMAATTYTGTGSAMTVANTVNGISFQPDFVWIKQRNNAATHVLADVIRGVSNYIFSNLTNAEATATGGTGITAFNSSGFALGTETSTSGSVNAAGGTGTYVAWQWKANGSGTLNQQGTINSTVSANTTAGFSVVTYTGTGANATVGHGLGVAPNMVIVKKRSTTGNWVVYHSNLTSAAYYLVLNLTAAQTSAATVWNSTAPTSSVFSLGSDTDVNASTATYVAYCFSTVAGYSAFGSYTANGVSGDGNFIYLGFRPRFVLYKRTDAASSWFIHDTARQNYNVQGPELYPEISAAEATATRIDMLSNGFKVRATGGSNPNVSGATYIYAAFAENPFSKALAF